MTNCVDFGLDPDCKILHKFWVRAAFGLNFDKYFVPLSSNHYHSTRLATSKNLFLPRVNSSSGKCSLKFIGPKVSYGLQYQTILNFQPPLPLNGNLRNTSKHPLFILLYLLMILIFTCQIPTRVRRHRRQITEVPNNRGTNQQGYQRAEGGKK